MIAFLCGVVYEIGANFFVLDVAGVGYKIIASPPILSSIYIGQETRVHIHDHIREDAHDLFGFLGADDLALFERLLNVDGVGPKVAMTILSVGSAETVRKAIMAGDLETLTSVPGVGKKTAQKIILELKGQLVEADAESGDDIEVVQALQSLGYTSQRGREAVKLISREMKDTSDRVREALRILSKK